MSDNTGIEWTDATWNPVRGCSRVSEGCRNCYAERVAARFSGPGQPYEGLARMVSGEPRWTGEVRLIEKHLNDPLRWKRPRRIFVNSMSDLFHEALDFRDVAAVFGVMVAARQHTFQVLTKRPRRALEFFAWLKDKAKDWASPSPLAEYSAHQAWKSAPWIQIDSPISAPWPLPNVWLGVSVEDQATADVRIPLLLQTPAAVRFISAEPLLGPIDLKNYLWARGHACWEPGYKPTPEDLRDVNLLARTVSRVALLDWVIVGGESGPGARPMRPEWAGSVRDQCVAAGAPYFFKQWGEWAPRENDERYQPDLCRLGKKAAGRLLDGREWNEFPKGA